MVVIGHLYHNNNNLIYSLPSRKMMKNWKLIHFIASDISYCWISLPLWNLLMGENDKKEIKFELLARFSLIQAILCYWLCFRKCLRFFTLHFPQTETNFPEIGGKLLFLSEGLYLDMKFDNQFSTNCGKLSFAGGMESKQLKSIIPFWVHQRFS